MHHGWCGTVIPPKNEVQARAGAREIIVDRPDLVRPGYTGLIDMANQRMGFPLVTAVDGKTGRCQLSAPLPRDIPAGKLTMVKLKYPSIGRNRFSQTEHLIPSPKKRSRAGGTMWLRSAIWLRKTVEPKAKRTPGSILKSEMNTHLEVFSLMKNFITIRLGSLKPISVIRITALPRRDTN